MQIRPLIITLYRKAKQVIILLSALLCLWPEGAVAEDRQYKLEAAFLYSFFNYITWPGYATPQDLIEPVICVYERDPILDYLEYVRRKMSNERNLSVRVVNKVEEMESCHMFFIRHRIPYHFEKAIPKHTLTVLKPDDPLDRGGLIELAEDEERIAIRIDQSELEAHGFRASSRLLELAKVAR